MLFYAGIDPGKHGAVAIVDNNLRVVEYHLFKEKGVYFSLKEVAKYKGYVYVVLEAQHPYSGQGVKSVFSLGENYGYIRGCLDAFGLVYQHIHPQTWHSKLGLRKVIAEYRANGSKQPSKDACIEFVRRIFKFSTNDHNLADALCLAYVSYLIVHENRISK